MPEVDDLFVSAFQENKGHVKIFMGNGCSCPGPWWSCLQYKLLAT